MLYPISVVLVRTLYARNIGASARAIENMGLSRLVLIDPQCEIDYSAKQSAANAQSPLENRIVYQNWMEFYKHEGEGLRVAFTARDGRDRMIVNFESFCKKIPFDEVYCSNWKKHTYLIFGPEDHGLNSNDLQFIHYATYLPTYGKNKSLNLAQAVLLSLFISRQNWSSPPELSPTEKLISTLEPLQFPDDAIQNWLELLGFSSEGRRISAYTTLKRLLLHSVPTPKEKQVLEKILYQTIRKLKTNNWGKPTPD